MPELTHFPVNRDWSDLDAIDRPIITFAALISKIGPVEMELHSHQKAQIIMVQRGALTCEVSGGLWIVPPGSAIWIPQGAVHAIKGSGLEGYISLIGQRAAVNLPATCCTLHVMPLLRELLVRSSTLPLFYDETDNISRLVSVLLDEIAAAQVETFFLPVPADSNLSAIIEHMMAVPAERGTLKSWAAFVGLSERTFARLIARETGMSFGRWQRQLSVLLAVKWMADGRTIQQVAADLGYESVPSFVTMFKGAMGMPPGRYMAERRIN